jgi:hypothetical protein
MFLPATATVQSAATHLPVARLDERLVTEAGSGSSAQVKRHPTAAGSVAAGVTLAAPIGGAAAPRAGHRVLLVHRSTGLAPKCIDESTTDPTLETAWTAVTLEASRGTEQHDGTRLVTVSRAPGASTRPDAR